MSPYTLQQAYDLIWSGSKEKLIFNQNHLNDANKDKPNSKPSTEKDNGILQQQKDKE